MSGARARAVRVSGEAARFAVAGVAASGVDVAVFWLLARGGLSPLVANPVSMCLRLGVAFWLTRVWVFPRRRGRPLAVEAAGFLAVAALNVACVQLALWLAMQMTAGALSAAAATGVKVIAIVLTFGVRFVLSRRLVFRVE